MPENARKLRHETEGSCEEVTKYHEGNLRKCQHKTQKESKSKKDVSSSEVKVLLLQDVSCKRALIFSSVNSGYKITHCVNNVSGEGLAVDEVKKKCFDCKILMRDAEHQEGTVRAEQNLPAPGADAPRSHSVPHLISEVVLDNQERTTQMLTQIPSAFAQFHLHLKKDVHWKLFYD